MSFNRPRQAQQIQIGSPDQGPAVGGRIWCKPLLPEFLQDEAIDRRAGPISILGRRPLARGRVWGQGGVRGQGGVPGQGAKRPEPAVFVADLERPFHGPIDEWIVVGRTQLKPAGDRGDRFAGKFRLLRWHMRFLLMPDQLEQTALSRGLADLAAVDEGIAVGKVESAHGLPAPVAGEAALNEERPNLSLEQLDALRHAARVFPRFCRGERVTLLSGR